jgi:hypothetical protein
MDDTLLDVLISGKPGSEGGPRKVREEMPKTEPPGWSVVSGMELDEELPPLTPPLMRISLPPLLLTPLLMLNPSSPSTTGAADCCWRPGGGADRRVFSGAEMREELADMGGDLRPLEEKTNMELFWDLMIVEV